MAILQCERTAPRGSEQRRLPSRIGRAPQVRDYVSLGNGFHVMDFRVPASLAGKRMDALGLRDTFDVRVLGLMRGTEFIACTSTAEQLQADDKLLLLGRREDMRRLGDSL